MSDTIIFLQLEHGTIARLLNLVEQQAQRFEREGMADLGLLQLALDYFVEYPDACHHPKEDAVYRRLQLRAPEVAEQIGDLLGDHGDLRKRTEHVADAIRKLQPGTRNGTDPATILREFVAEYRHHLLEEEARFLPLAAKTLTREDWELIDFEVFERDDPLYDETVENRFSELRRIIKLASEVEE